MLSLLEPTYAKRIKSRAIGRKCAEEFVEEGTDEDPEEVDEIMEMQAIEAAQLTTTSLPDEMFAYVQFGYDKSLKAKLSSEYNYFSSWIDDVMTHVQAHYRHGSLTTKIQFKVFSRKNIRILIFQHYLIKTFSSTTCFIIIFLLFVHSMISMTRLRKPTKTSQVLKMAAFVHGHNTHLPLLKVTLRLMFLLPLDTIHQN